MKSTPAWSSVCHYCRDSTTSFQRETDWRHFSFTQPLDLEKTEEGVEEREEEELGKEEEGEREEGRDMWMEEEWNPRSQSGRDRRKTFLVM